MDAIGSPFGGLIRGIMGACSGAYLPFSGGPRLCIGNEFALMEATLVSAMISQRYRLQLVPRTMVEPESRLALRPRGGLPMTLRDAA